MSERKVFAFISARYGTDDLSVMAVSDDGFQLAGHISSSVDWAKHDIGIGSTWKHDAYREYFGEQPYAIEWVEDPDNHAGLADAARKAQARRDAEVKS